MLRLCLAGGTHSPGNSTGSPPREGYNCHDYRAGERRGGKQIKKKGLGFPKVLRNTVPKHVVIYTTNITSINTFFLVEVSFHLPVLTEIFCAIILPPITAKPVHRQCPTVPPTATP